MKNQITSTWSGSETTFEIVRKQISTRWGADEANKYNPKSNCLTFNRWLQNGYKVKKGEKALHSFIVVEEKDKDGQVVKKLPKRINLFYVLQVEKASKTKKKASAKVSSEESKSLS